MMSINEVKFKKKPNKMSGKVKLSTNPYFVKIILTGADKNQNQKIEEYKNNFIILFFSKIANVKGIIKKT